MSLASRISNLFSGHSVTVPDRAENKLGDDGLADEKLGFTHGTSAESIYVDSDTMAPQDDEEEGRPPYLHVSDALCDDKVNIG